jgi:hypothetical protein
MQSITQDSVREALQPPADFAYEGSLPIGETWSLGPMILNRDSGPLEQSNAAAVRKTFESLFGPECEDNGWEVTRCNHWAVGWVDHLSFRAIDDNGGPTQQFVEMARLNAEVEENIVLDEDDLCAREWDDLIEYLEWHATPFLKESVPDDWPELLAREVHNDVVYESAGVWVKEEHLKNALDRLDWLETEEEA